MGHRAEYLQECLQEAEDPHHRRDDRPHGSRVRRRLVATAVVVGALIIPSPAQAQATGALLLGLLTLDRPRPSVGVAFGYSPSVAGFEIEYLGTVGGESGGHSSAGGIFANVIVHPATVGALQLFVVGGFGLWGEKFEDGKGTGELGATDIGGGVRIWMTEHLRLRLDYRLFLLGDPEGASGVPSSRHPQRFSAGLHLAF